MDVATSAKQRLENLFKLYIENPSYEGVEKQLVKAIEAYHQISVIQKDLQEEGY